ncbi:MAG: tRNA (adenosine(37)-N6)-threonylcarbamoyltransferase complex dimerization subunit type 1 TsaB [Clostridia bacterium]|nr:tRNA (adenosine(37)-N6)-threonylcarbamoyltransferase complex dimerization subunit type 1 TsaB [Clostridia bacterium]
MKILAIECSATPASCAILENGNILAEAFTNIKITHSQGLLPLAESVLKAGRLTLNDIDAFAVAAGPGSFTGVRIGIAAIKGLAAPQNKPCCAVSTLLAMAQNFIDSGGIICCVMDARCSQVYNALFKVENGVITRLTPDRALMCEELARELKKYKRKNIIITGDGTKVFMPYVKGMKVTAAAPCRAFQNAVGVALAAQSQEFCKAQELMPTYLRLPQAERELKAKQERN